MIRLLKRKSLGFTLIELLIVVAIIGILAAILTSNFVAIRERARDAQRKSDLRQLQSALELYRADNGSYPIDTSDSRLPGGVGVANCPSAGSFTYGGTTYMKKVPCDPLGTAGYNSGNYYYYSSDGINYKLDACIENQNDTDQNITTTAPSGPTICSGSTKYFELQNP